MRDHSIGLLKTLTEAAGVSGFEAPVRKLLRDYLSPYCDTLETDNMGSLIFCSRSAQEAPKIMLAAHMDEVGFMVTKITEGGFIKFQELGGWWSQVLLDQRVEILEANGSVTGVIGAKAPHILSVEERGQLVAIKSMFIDIGATSREEAERSGIKVGDPIVPCGRFEMCVNNKSFMAKAIDDRAGCAMIVEAFRELGNGRHPGALYGVMTVQEEVGLRGAATSVSVVKPDVAIVLDVTVAMDTPDISDAEAITKTQIGKGPVICFYDASMIPHVAFRDLVTRTAEEKGIPYQIEIMPGGGTDAGKIHVYREGVPSIVIGIPVRYIHDHIGIASLDDYRYAVELVCELVRELDADTVNRLRE